MLCALCHQQGSALGSAGEAKQAEALCWVLLQTMLSSGHKNSLGASR